MPINQLKLVLEMLIPSNDKGAEIVIEIVPFHESEEQIVQQTFNLFSAPGIFSLVQWNRVLVMASHEYLLN